MEEKYGLLPPIPEHIMEELLGVVEEFATLLKQDPEEAERSLHQELEWLKGNKDFLGKAVLTSVDAALDLYGDKLSHRDWTDLQFLLLKSVLVVLQSINQATKEGYIVATEESAREILEEAAAIAEKESKSG